MAGAAQTSPLHPPALFSSSLPLPFYLAPHETPSTTHPTYALAVPHTIGGLRCGNFQVPQTSPAAFSVPPAVPPCSRGPSRPGHTS